MEEQWAQHAEQDNGFAGTEPAAECDGCTAERRNASHARFTRPTVRRPGACTLTGMRFRTPQPQEPTNPLSPEREAEINSIEIDVDRLVPPAVVAQIDQALVDLNSVPKWGTVPVGTVRDLLLDVRNALWRQPNGEPSGASPSA